MLIGEKTLNHMVGKDLQSCEINTDIAKNKIHLKKSWFCVVMCHNNQLSNQVTKLEFSKQRKGRGSWENKQEKEDGVRAKVGE